MIAELIGIPWKADASSLDGCSCWGLLQLYYQREKQITIPDVTDGEAMRGRWLKVSSPLPGDVVLFRTGSTKRHVGVVINQSDMLHVDTGKDSCIESYRGWTWKNRLIGIYRHR